MKKYLLAAGLALIFFTVQVFTLSDYGINWDAPFRMLRGRAYLHYFLTGRSTFNKDTKISPVLIKPNEYASYFTLSAFETGEVSPVVLPDRPLPHAEYLKTQKVQRSSFYKDDSWDDITLREFDGGHPPLVDLLAGLSNKILFAILGWIGDIQSYQIVYCLISSIGVFLTTLFSFEIVFEVTKRKSTAFIGALVSGLALSMFPLFFSEAHFNMKDPLQASFLVGAVWSFWHYVKENRVKWFILLVIFTALCLGVKWNIIFLPIILGLWLVAIRNTAEFKKWFQLKLLWQLVVLLGASALFIIAIWPYMWDAPVQKLLGILFYYKNIGIGDSPIQPAGFILPLGFNIYPSLLVFAQTPEVILLFSFIALVGVYVWKRRDSLATITLLLLWVLIPILRASLPYVWFYSGYRQIMEILPALALLAGYGFALSYEWLRKKAMGWAIVPLLIIFFVSLFYPLMRLHPNENVYFNTIVGGLKGAENRHFFDWTLTYGNIYKQGVIWLNAHAEKDANVAHLDGPMYAASLLWFRPDISISPYHFSGFEQKGEYIFALYNPLNPAHFAFRYPNRFLQPVHKVVVDGVPLLTIYKNSPQYVRPAYRKSQETMKVAGRPISDPKGDYIEVSLDTSVGVTKIVVENPRKSCEMGQHEIIAFLKEQNSAEGLQPSELYTPNYAKRLTPFTIEYDFPAEKAGFIRIYPLDTTSCFVGGNIRNIQYIPL